MMCYRAQRFSYRRLNKWSATEHLASLTKCATEHSNHSEQSATKCYRASLHQRCGCSKTKCCKAARLSETNVLHSTPIQKKKCYKTLRQFQKMTIATTALIIITPSDNPLECKDARTEDKWIHSIPQVYLSAYIENQKKNSCWESFCNGVFFFPPKNCHRQKTD